MSCLHGRPAAVRVDWSSLITLYLSPSKLVLVYPTTFRVVMSQLLYLMHVTAEVYASHTRKILVPPA
jgi:hypothetical protein